MFYQVRPEPVLVALETVFEMAELEQFEVIT